MLQEAAADASKYSKTHQMIAANMPNMVKGVGFARPGGVAPIDDDTKIFGMAAQATKSLVDATKAGYANPAKIAKGFSGEFASRFGAAVGAGNVATGLQSIVADLNTQLSAALGKNFTIGTPGGNSGSPLGSGFVPFDLLAPSRLIYPVYSPLRNKLPRTPGQGEQRRAKLVLGVQGSQTGGTAGNPARISIAETLGQSLSTTGVFPTNPAIPNSGTQKATDLIVPYRFFGMSEALSWLSQFSGQGFEDISSLANLILLQQAMLGEEYQIIAGSKTVIASPTAPTAVVRTAGSNETAFTATGTYSIEVTAKTYFGESVHATGSVLTGVVVGANQVVDVTITGQPTGVTSYNVYVNASNNTTRASFFLSVAGVGGKRVTLQGLQPTAGTSPPSADTGTFSANDFDGMFQILGGGAVDYNGSTSGDAALGIAGYYNAAIGDTLNTNVVNTALKTLWDGNTSSVGGTATSGYRADPTELIGEGTDIANFGVSLLANQGGPTAYQFLIDQNEVGNVTGGVAISQFTNPITRSMVKIMVHPWFPQGSATLMSYTMPMTWSNVSNVWENVMVQDYLSVAWPVIDLTFRYSLFYFGALLCYAPAYNGLLQGLQKSATTPYS
jgi:hypothetical protein